jgi:hypothetical protein
MTDRETLRALIERVEQATGADAAINADVAWMLTDPSKRRCGPPDMRRRVWHAGLPTPAWADWESVASFHLHYTSSLDAAASLAPEGYSWRVESPGGYAYVRRPADNTVHGYPKREAYARTAALALTAAALRARLAEMEARDE